MNRTYYKKWILILVASQFIITTLRGQTCPTFGFCMEEPYYEELYGLWAIDVYLVDFDGNNAAGIFLTIDYSNNDIELDQTRTEESLLVEVKEGCGGSFDFTTEGTIILSGIQPPLDVGEILTNIEKQLIFIIYFSAAAGECFDFTFEMQDILVSFPLLMDYEICPGAIGTGCEVDDYCIPGFTVGGIIESPVLDCDDSSNGGIIGIAVELEESNSMPLFSCSEETNAYGEYECLLVEGLDYRITPVHDFNRACGLSSLDIDIYFDHILGTDCIDHLWAFLAGDVDQDGLLESYDMVDIQKAILEIDGTDWESWSFVPSSVYNGMTLPSCLEMNSDIIPAYDPYIEIEDLDDDYSTLDFVAIKMGDANGTCTVCSQSFAGEEEILSRNAPQIVELTMIDQELYSLSFPKDVIGLEVMMLAFTCDTEPRIKYSALQNSINFISLYRDGVFYISYASSIEEGESILQNDPFLILEGKLAGSKIAGARVHNEIIVDNILSSVELRCKDRPGAQVYPNPTKGEISIMLGELNFGESAVFSIYSLQGNKLFERDILGKASSLNLQLQPGVYFYIIESTHLFASAKLIIL